MQGFGLLALRKFRRLIAFSRRISFIPPYQFIHQFLHAAYRFTATAEAAAAATRTTTTTTTAAAIRLLIFRWLRGDSHHLPHSRVAEEGQHRVCSSFIAEHQGDSRGPGMLQPAQFPDVFPPVLDLRFPGLASAEGVAPGLLFALSAPPAVVRRELPNLSEVAPGGRVTQKGWQNLPTGRAPRSWRSPLRNFFAFSRGLVVSPRVHVPGDSFGNPLCPGARPCHAKKIISCTYSLGTVSTSIMFPAATLAHSSTGSLPSVPKWLGTQRML